MLPPNFNRPTRCAMNTTDFIASLALLVSGASFGIQFFQWLRSGPRLKLSLMADAVEFPKGDGKPKLALTVTNRGEEPTMITHMIAFTYETRWKRFRRKPTMTAIVNSPNIPSELQPKHYWMGFMVYNDKAMKERRRNKLYVGVIASHSDRNFLVKVPSPKESNIPTERI